MVNKLFIINRMFIKNIITLHQVLKGGYIKLKCIALKGIKLKGTKFKNL